MMVLLWHSLKMQHLSQGVPAVCAGQSVARYVCVCVRACVRHLFTSAGDVMHGSIHFVAFVFTWLVCVSSISLLSLLVLRFFYFWIILIKSCTWFTMLSAAPILYCSSILLKANMTSLFVVFLVSVYSPSGNSTSSSLLTNALIKC